MRTLLRRTAQAGTALLIAGGGLMISGGSAQASTYYGADPAMPQGATAVSQTWTGGH